MSAAAIDAALAPVPSLFFHRGCPFAQRVLALVDHLGCPLERRRSLVGDPAHGLERYAVSDPLPLLVHGDLVLTESRVMMEHLAEVYSFADAWPASLADRTRHRHAMAVVDHTLVPELRGHGPGLEAGRVTDSLDAIEAATATTSPRPCLLTLHLAPIGRAFRLWRPDGMVTRAIAARPELARWLDAAAALDCVARAEPDPSTHAEDFARARRAGLI